MRITPPKQINCVIEVPPVETNLFEAACSYRVDCEAPGLVEHFDKIYSTLGFTLEQAVNTTYGKHAQRALAMKIRDITRGK